MLEIQDYEVMGFRMAIKGMRNPLNSWDKSDSEQCGFRCLAIDDSTEKFECNELCGGSFLKGYTQIGPSDIKLAKSLIKAGSSDRKFLRMIHVQAEVLAPLYFWKEADQYKIGTTTNSCSTMHTIHKREFTLADFSKEHISDTPNCDPLYYGALECLIETLNEARHCYLDSKDKDYWWQIIQLLPSSYNQLRTWDLDYETLLSIYFQRRHHKLNEWHTFCDWIISLPYMKEFISVLDKKEESNEQ